MTNPVAIVRTEVASFDEPRTPICKALLFWCPGCDDSHRITFWRAEGQPGPVWGWDNSLEAPTVDGSLLVQGVQWKPSSGFHKPSHAVPPGGPTVCHSFLVAGRWEFLTDSTHALAGQIASMVPLPDWLVRES